MSDYQTTVDRIRTILNVSESSPLDDLRALADDFAEACLDANRRLSDCAKFLRVGNLPEALRLAETPPRILEICNLLDFPERADWEDVCRTYRLTRPTVPNAATLEQLNRAFEEVAPIDELLRKHRFLALARAPLGERLDVLYSLAERDFSNMIWGESIPPLENALDLEIANAFEELSRKFEWDPAETVQAATELYRRLTDVRRTTTAPKELTRRVKVFLDDAARRTFADRFRAFEKAASEALAGDAAAKKRALAAGNSLFSAAQKNGASAPRSSIDAKFQLENALQASAKAEAARRVFQSKIETWREELRECDEISELEAVFDEIATSAPNGAIPNDLIELRNEKETEIRVAAEKKRRRVVVAAVVGGVLFLLAAAGLATLFV